MARSKGTVWMDRKRASVMILFILIAGLLHFTIVILPERAEAMTLYVGGSGPSNYTTIQDAINTANPGDKVFVYSGLYYENIRVDKTLELEGEDRDATAINGSQNIDTVLITADWVNVTGFNMTYSSIGYAGIKLEYVSNCSIEGNTVSHSGDGIGLERSSHNFIGNNTLHSNRFSDMVLSYSDFNTITNNVASSDNWSAVALFSSKGNIVKGNTMENNGIYINGDSLEYWNTHTIDPSNIVNGKPVYYLKNATGVIVPAGAGQVIVANSTLVTIKDQNLNNTVRGIQVAYSSNNMIDNNTIGFCRTDAIYLYYSDNITITDNTAFSNGDTGIELYASKNGTVAFNNVSSHASYGISLGYSSDGTSVLNNTLWDNRGGIAISSSRWTAHAGNIMLGEGMLLFGAYVEHWNTHTIETTNSVNGKPVYYWKNVTGGLIPSGAGQVILANSTSVTVENQDVSNGSMGVELGFSSNNAVAGVNSSGNIYGIFIWHSNRNVITNCTSSYSYVNGIVLGYSNNNTLSTINASANNRAVLMTYSDNNTLTGIDANYNDWGIYLAISDDNDFLNISARHNSRHGVYMIISERNRLHNVDVSDSYNGIEVRDSPYSTIEGSSVVRNQWDGILLSGSDHGVIKNNSITDNREGLTIDRSDFISVTDNDISSNSYGVWLSESSSCTISGNNISFSVQDGIIAFQTGLSTFSENDMYLNGGTGLRLSSSDDNQVFHNNFMYNTQQAYDNSNTNVWENGYPSGGNYWSDYGGVDLRSGPFQDLPGSDSIGDTPYFVFPDNLDRYPLMGPYENIFPRPPEIISADLTGVNLENVTIRWNLSLDDGQGTYPVVQYRIFRNTMYNHTGFGYQLLAVLPNGIPEYTDGLAGEGDPDNYFYRVCAVDTRNLTKCSELQAGKFTKSLAKGLALVSVPLMQSNESIGRVLQTVSNDKAWYYDSAKQEWVSIDVLKPYSKGFGTVNHSIGFWVNVTQDSNMTIAGIVPIKTSIQLYAGWNLIAFPSFQQDYTVADLRAVTGAWQVEGYNASADPYFLRSMSDGDHLSAGDGFWVLVPADVIWSIGNT